MPFLQCHIRLFLIKTASVPSLFKTSVNVGAEDIMNGARKGIIVLQETYRQNISNFCIGDLNIKTSVKYKLRAVDSLKPDDLTAISVLAFNLFKWYDTSLLFLKEAISIVKETMMLRNYSTGKSIAESLNTILNDIVSYQNKLKLPGNIPLTNQEQSLSDRTGI